MSDYARDRLRDRQLQTVERRAALAEALLRQVRERADRMINPPPGCVVFDMVPMVNARDLLDLIDSSGIDLTAQPERTSMSDAIECWWFRWVGQPFYCCDACGEPAWTHRGDLRFPDPFGPSEAVPWPDGTAAAIRRKWEPAMHAAGYIPPSVQVTA